MDTQNDGSEKVDSFTIWPFLVSIVKFLGYKSCQDFVVKEVFKSFRPYLSTNCAAVNVVNGLLTLLVNKIVDELG